MLIVNFKKSSVFKWVLSSYVTYALNFISTIILVNKLGVKTYADWALIILYISYVTQINLGITHSYYITQMTDQRSTIRQQLDYLVNAVFIFLIFTGIIFVVLGINYFFGVFRNEILSSYKLIIVVFSSISAMIVAVISNFYRIRNKLNLVIIAGLISPIIVICLSLVFQGEKLYDLLLIQLVVSPILALIFLLKPIFKKLILAASSELMFQLISKGIWLFLYNLSYYYILLSFRGFYSWHSNKHEFGIFSFAMVLCNSLLLFVDAIAYAMNSKQIRRSISFENLNSVLLSIKENNSLFSVLAIFLSSFFLIAASFVLKFTPDYKTSIVLIPKLLFGILVSNFSAGNVIYLMGKNRLTDLSISSAVSLLVCVIVLLFLGATNNKELFWLSLLFSFTVFNLITSFFVIKQLSNSFLTKVKLSDLVPLNLYFFVGVLLWSWSSENLVLFVIVLLVFSFSFWSFFLSFYSTFRRSFKSIIYES